MGLNLILKGINFPKSKRIEVVDQQQYVDLFLQSCYGITTDEANAIQALADTLISANLFAKIDCIYPILGASERTAKLNLRSSKYSLDFNPPKTAGGSIVFSEGGFYIETSDPTGTTCPPVNTQFRQNDENAFMIVHLGTKVKNYSNPKPISISFPETGVSNENDINSIIYTDTPVPGGSGVQVGVMQSVNTMTEELIEIKGLNDPEGTLFVNRLGSVLTLRHNGTLLGTKTVTQIKDARNSKGSFVFGYVSSRGTYGLFNNPIKFAMIGYGLTDYECTTLQNAVTTFLTAVGK